MTVWIYEAGRETMKVFVSEEVAQAWFEHDPEGVAFAYPVIENEKSPDTVRHPGDRQGL